MFIEWLSLKRLLEFLLQRHYLQYLSCALTSSSWFSVYVDLEHIFFCWGDFL